MKFTKQMQEEIKAEKPGHRVIGRLWLLYLMALAVASLLVADWLLETRGVPQSVVDHFKRRLASEGIDFSASKVRCGIWKGAFLDNVSIETGRKFESPSLTAKRITASFSLLRLLKGNFLPISFEIDNGRLSIPVFPESGAEGMADCVVISDFNGAITLSHGRIFVDNASGKFQSFEFRMSGTIDNLIVAAGAKGGAALHDKLSGVSSTSSDIQSSSAPRQPAAATQHNAKAQDKSPVLHPGFTFISKVPLQFRRRFMRAMDRLKTERFASSPKCEVNFALDLADFRKSVVKAQITTPSFEYGLLKIGSMRQDLSLKDGVLELKDIHVELGGGEYIEASGVCDSSANTVSGDLSGLCGASKLMLFLDEPTRRRLNAKFKFGDDFIAFKGSLQSFSLSSGRYTGVVDFHVPNLIFNGITFGNISGNAKIDDNTIKGHFSTSSVDSDGELEGDFSLAKDSIDCAIEGSASFDTAKKFLSPSSRGFVDESVKVASEDKLVSFSGSLKADELKRSSFSGSFDLLVPQICFKDLETKMLSAHLDFNGETLKLSDIHATLDDGTRLSGEMLCKPSEKILSASMVCQGSPERALSLLGPEQRGFIKSIIKDIDWPLSGNLVESSIDLHYRYGANPFCFMTGSLVMTDFEYRGIKFKYGATRFIVDSDRMLILPGAILETKDGQALISICYRAGADRDKFRLYQPGLGISEGDQDIQFPPEGRLDFEISSALSGNNLLRCFYPQWKSEYLDFPKSLQVNAKGSIDYKSPEKSCFNARLQNGACVWKGASISNIDASLIYKNRRLLFKGSSAEIGGGKLGADYDFNFETLSGDVDVKIQDADLQSLLKQIGWGEIIGGGKPGKLSGALSSKIWYDKDVLLMDGEGRLGIAGADLWSIPLFGDFLKFLGRAWSLDSLGSITTVDCDYKLVKDHFETDSIKSDGGFVALRGGGKYYWNSNEFDFKFRAELLKGALPFETMSRLLSPVSWILEKRLHGRDLDYKWE